MFLFLPPGVLPVQHLPQHLVELRVHAHDGVPVVTVAVFHTPDAASEFGLHCPVAGSLVWNLVRVHYLLTRVRQQLFQLTEPLKQFWHLDHLPKAGLLKTFFMLPIKRYSISKKSHCKKALQLAAF